MSTDPYARPDEVERHWERTIFRVESDPVPNKSILGRVRIIDVTGSLVCFETKAQVDWLIQALIEARQHAWPQK